MLVATPCCSANISVDFTEGERRVYCPECSTEVVITAHRRIAIWYTTELYSEMRLF